ncbi:Uu.00g016110.m01.CDS01 [Anthostomella pinea]|uniref:Uu.00g016110.m01.CDS01 n=1 Tax=Anthostomella pinea TaxID=933095 RepID=A0AAI8VYN5_9PEZI|nr:Uu.00g016110.m01.CDS01 [Anthostomella pinea]
MAKSSLLTLLGVLTARASASPCAPGVVTDAANPARQCHNLTIPVSISARNGLFNLTAPSNNIEVTDFILNQAQPGKNYTEAVLEGYATVQGNYSIAATYCEPTAGPGKTLQVLTHGIGFDRSYWDFPLNNYNYSYVNAAIAKGYSTFAFDRLGIHQSSHGEPVNEIQSWLEIAALRSLTAMLRQATLPGVTTHYDKIVHVGHSFGSIQTYGLTAMDPTISDGIALTGFSQAPMYAAYFLLGGNFVEANGAAYALKDYPNGYLAAGDASGVQTNFFALGEFDPAVLAEAYMTGQPVTVGELLTLSGPAASNNSFGGPVLVITGDRDIPFCGGNCLAADPSPSSSKQYFGNTSDFETVIVPATGHGLNLQYSWPTTYAAILDFFDKTV